MAKSGKKAKIFDTKYFGLIIGVIVIGVFVFLGEYIGIFDRIELTEDSGLICVELMAKIARAGCRIAEVPVHHFHRMHGQSQFFNFRRVLRVLFRMIGLWWRLCVRREPS